ncbi:MAG TPA: IPExxxVDY family protein [Vicingaceae bacterium]|jgi:hypothetical protein|nr:IPExxxVDY family protein [Vicingaceae bacterium]
MSKLTLSLDEEYDFELIGMSCHLRDYRICWSINQLLKIDLTRVDDYEVIKNNEVLTFSFYEFFEEEDGVEYYVLSNKCEKGYLIPEKQNFDYFMILKGNTEEELLQNITQQIKSVNGVNITHQIDVNELKSKRNLIF